MICDEPYYHLKLAHVSMIHFGVIAGLLSIALYHINDPTHFTILNTDKRTLWAMVNYKVNKDGVKYYNYTDPETGEKVNGDLSQLRWFDKRLKGQYVYLYGVGQDNYCWPRPISDSEWLPSLFRSGQLKPTVQVPLRAALLLGMAFRIFQAILLAYLKIYRGPECKLNICLGRIFILNEILQNASLFYVVNFLITPDKNYVYLVGPSIIAAYVTFSLKMWLSAWHSGLHLTTGIRIFLFLAVSQTIVPNYTSCLAYLHHNYCDHYVPPIQAFNELTILFCLLISEFLDIHQTRTIECVVESTEDAYQGEMKLPREASSLS